VSAKLKRSIALLTMTAASGLILPWAAVEARKPGEAEAPRPQAARPEANNGAAAAEERAAQAQQRKGEMEEARAQQEQGRQQHEASMQQAAQARQQQEQGLREQEQQSRKAQQEAQKAQQEQARQLQQSQEQSQRQQQRAEQPRAEQTRAEQPRAEQEHAEQPRAGQPQGREQQRQQAAMIERAPGGAAAGQPGGAHNEPAGRSASFAKDRSGNPVFGRSTAPAQMTAPRLALQKAVPMPFLPANANAGERQHLEDVQNNLQQHMYAVAAADAPANFNSMPKFARQAYFNNYQTMINNQQFIINRQNTFLNPLDQNQWPVWYQPQPNWQFCNGFTLGGSAVADLNWLRWGWHPYYGPQPDGFVCANDYVPTPWIYVPAYGTWRQPGVNSYAAYGPPYDYTGPISVEVFEPRHVNVDIPFVGSLLQRVINAVYFYNAYYYPEYGRYGYMNRHNSWIWLNLGTQPF
jgi:hypothetical protein